MLQPLLLLPVSLLLGSVPLAAAADVETKAFNWESGGNWDGDDGEWSTFHIRVGTPQKYARVLPNTAFQEILVVLPDACPGSLVAEDKNRILDINGEPTLCSDDRGLVINVNDSTTWYDRGIAIIDLGIDMGLEGRAMYGQDVVGLTVDDSGVTLQKQVVGGLVAEDFWVGSFGLGNRGTNFSETFSDPQASWLDTLWHQGYIPSLSWGYAVGASYRNKGTKGVVTFGGYDRSRFAPNTPTVFQNSALSCVLLNLTYTSTSDDRKTNFNLFATDEENPEGVARLDSTAPYMYLPNATVALIEEAFNLTYNETLKIYPVSKEQHDAMLKINPTFTFSIADNKTSSEIIEIEVPYDAFDLKAGQGLTGTNVTTYYFPMRRSTVESGIVLGRAFMQEVYVMNDYQRGQWSLAKAVWKDNYQADIVDVLTVGNTTTSGSGSKSNVGAIAGGTVGGLAALVGLIALGVFAYKRKGSGGEGEKKDNLPGPDVAELGGAQLPNPRHEMDGAGGAAPPINAAAPIGVGAWSGDRKDYPVEIDGQTPLTTPATESGYSEIDSSTYSGHGHHRFPQNQFVAELDAGPVIIPEMEGSTPAEEKNGFRFGASGRHEMPTPPPPPPPPPPAQPAAY